MKKIEEIELNKIYNEDCLEGMKRIPDGGVKFLLTDPPYGIDFQSQWRKNKDEWKPKIINDKSPFTKFIKHIKRIISEDGSVAIFTRWDVQQQFIDEMTKHGMKPKNILIWDKCVHGMGDLKRAYGSRYESIIFWSNDGFRFNGKRPADIFKFQRVSPTKTIHPNEKPVELLEKIIQQTTHEGETVLDLFSGSASTAIAAINTDRNYIGFELDKHYYDLAEKRIKEYLEQKEKTQH